MRETIVGRYDPRSPPAGALPKYGGAVNMDMRDALSAWENEGGAWVWPGTADAPSRMISDGDEILKYLGGAVVAHWDELPQNFKQALFRELSAQTVGPDPKNLKERLARYLHTNGGNRASCNPVLSLRFPE